MICAYCGKEARGTKEHIISSSVLRLFPECPLTIDPDRKTVYKSDPVVKDVCQDCNNKKIAYIDSYAKDFIEKYFLKKYSRFDTLTIDYNYNLLQKMCLKYAYNDLRARKKSTIFFDDEIKKYLLDSEKTVPLKNVTLLAGLVINTSPEPNYDPGNKKIRWSDSPIFFSNSLIENIDYETGIPLLRFPPEIETVQNCALTYVFRFNSIQILLLCWKKELTDADIHQNELVLQCVYPYQLLNSSGISELSRCTSGITYHFEKLIDARWGQALWDEVGEIHGEDIIKIDNHLGITK